MEGELNRVSKSLEETKRELEQANTRLSGRIEETRGNQEKMVQLRDGRIRELEGQLGKRMAELGELAKRVEDMPSVLAAKVSEVRAEY